MQPNRLTLAEKVEIIRLVGDNARSTREAAREFNARHPNRPPISNTTVLRVNQNFDLTGSVVKSGKRNRRHPNDEVIINYLEENNGDYAKRSLSQMSRDLNISISQIRGCLCRHKKKPFKPKFLHTLQEGDQERRMDYCLWAQGEFLNNLNFLSRVLFTDEAVFTTNGVVSAQNSRYWSTENPYWIINCKSQYSQKVNVWCGILGDRLIGPFFFNENLTAERFLDFLENSLWDVIEELPIQTRLDMYFQLDGASVHNAAIVREWLNEHFPNKWIGRNSPLIQWPTRSPDLTPLDFYLWGMLKSKVYKSRPRNRDELCNRIRQACLEITCQELRKVTRNNRKRIEKCVALNGGFVEKDRI